MQKTASQLKDEWDAADALGDMAARMEVSREMIDRFPDIHGCVTRAEIDGCIPPEGAARIPAVLKSTCDRDAAAASAARQLRRIVSGL